MAELCFGNNDFKVDFNKEAFDKQKQLGFPQDNFTEEIWNSKTKSYGVWTEETTEGTTKKVNSSISSKKQNFVNGKQANGICH